MTKRTAMLMAAGVVAALLGGSVALAFGLSGNTAAVADTPAKREPIVRTVHRTVRVDKQAKGSDQPVQVVTVAADTSSSDPVASSDDSMDEGTGSESDDVYEDDDAYGSEDDESEDDDSTEDHESEDDDSTEDGFEDD